MTFIRGKTRSTVRDSSRDVIIGPRDLMSLTNGAALWYIIYMNGISKNILREKAKEIRNAIPDARRNSDAIQLKKNVIACLNDSSIHVIQNDVDYMDKPCNDGDLGLIIGTYYPIGSEMIPPHNLKNYQMALPVVRNKTTLEFYEWANGDLLVTKDFNIPIPDTRGKTPIHPDILLLPLLLCDSRGNRIGYGAGHYDRYIDGCDKKPLLIGVCFDQQIWPELLPVESHDQPLDLIITPKRVIETS